MNYKITILFSVLASIVFGSTPSGYYSSINGKQSAALKTELHNILMQDTSRYYSSGSGANHNLKGFYYSNRIYLTKKYGIYLM